MKSGCLHVYPCAYVDDEPVEEDEIFFCSNFQKIFSVHPEERKHHDINYAKVKHFRNQYM